MNGDVCVAAETAQWPSTVYCFPCIVHKDDALWADEVDQKNADAMSTDEDSVHCVNSNLQLINIDERAGLLESDSATYSVTYSLTFAQFNFY